MKKMFSSSRTAALLALLLCTMSFPALAQNETGTRPLYLRNSSDWYDSTMAMFQTRYPIIRSIPPLSTGMPFDVLLSYIYVDSLLRFAPSGEVVKRMRKWTSANDTLKMMVRALYRMVDFNPIIFNQYADEVAHYKKPVYGAYSRKTGDTTTYTPPPANGFGRYTTDLNDVALVLAIRFRHLLEPKSEMIPLYALLECDYILRVRILSIDSTKDKYTPLNYNRYSVTAEVLDTIKGQIFQTIEPESLPSAARENILSSSHPLFHFEYTPNVYMAYGDWDSERTFDIQRDSAFTTKRGEFKMAPGQEAVIFLKHGNPRIDDTHDYYDVDIDYVASTGALFMVDGQVRDLNHIWSDSILTDYAVWKTRALQLRDKILNGQY